MTARENGTTGVRMALGSAARLGLRLAAAGLVLGWGIGASASTWKSLSLLSEYQAAPWRIGPFRIRPQFRLNNAGYDSNVYGSSETTIGDYGLTAGPSLKLYARPSRHVLLLFTESTARERAWNNSYEGHAHVLFNRWTLSLGASRSDVKQMVNLEILEFRPRIRTDSLQAALLWQAGRKSSLSVAWEKILLKYDQEAALGFGPALDRNEERLAVAVYRQFSAKFLFNVKLEHGLFRFNDPSSLRNTRAASISAGFRFSPTGRLSGSAEVGLRRFVPAEERKNPYGGYFGDVNLSYRVHRSWSVRAAFRRDFPFSYYFADTYFVMNSWRVGISAYALRFLRFDIDHVEGENRYPEISGSEASSGSFRTNTAAVFVRLWKDIGIGLTAGRTHQNLPLPAGASASREFAFVSLIYGF
jgi:hypothetical protein